MLILQQLLIWLAASIFLVTAYDIAAATADTSDPAADTLPEVVVTASRISETADSTLAPVTIIDRTAIERSQASNVPELIKRHTGISISNNGGMGQATGIFVRGTNAEHVLVLIDGVKIGSATLGTTPWQDLPLALIERIEIVRGPRSSLYGSEAIGGVIQIFTHKGGGKTRFQAALGAGSHELRRIEAQVSGGGSKTWWSLGVSDLDTAGFDSRTDGAEPDKDGYHNRAYRIRGGLSWDAGHSLDVYALRAEGENEYDQQNPVTLLWDQQPETSDTVTQTLGARLSFLLLDDLDLLLAVSESRDESEFFTAGVATSSFDTRRRNASIQTNWILHPQHTLTMGFDYQKDKVSASQFTYTKDRRTGHGIFTQYRGSISRYDWQLALRHDDDSQFGDATTGNIALGVRILDKLQFTAAYGTAFKAPTFNALYWPNDVWSVGNPDLKPEKSHTTEIGLRSYNSNITWAVNLFETWVDDLIAWQQIPNTWTWQPMNINKARIRGIEGEFAVTLADWQLSANVTFQEPESRSGNTIGKRLQRRARRLSNLNLDRKFGSWSLGATVHNEGDRYDDQNSTTRLSGFTTVDLRAMYAINRAWSVEAKASNLLNADYQTAFGFRQPGRELLVTLRYTLD